MVDLEVVERLVSESASRPRTAWSRGNVRHAKIIDRPPKNRSVQLF
jgi:hypothetical protein